MTDYTSLTETQVGPARKQDWSYLQLRDWIITGDLVQGERVDETRMAERLGVSRIPLRQALGRLASESLVIERPHRGWIVSPMSLAGAEDVYAGRTALEVVLARAAAVARTDEDVAHARSALETQSQLIEAGRYADSRAWDRVFHTVVYESSGMRHSLAAFAGLRLLSERYIHVYLDDPSRVQKSLAEHKAIFRAFEAGDADAIATATEAHVQDGITVLRSLLTDAPDA